MRRGLLLYPPSTQTGWNWLWRSSARPSREWPTPTARTWTRISLVSCGCVWLFILWKQHAVLSSSVLSSPSGNTSQRVVAMQPETKAMMDLILEKDFTLSVALDGGSLVTTYPYDKPVQSGKKKNILMIPAFIFFCAAPVKNLWPCLCQIWFDINVSHCIQKSSDFFFFHNYIHFPIHSIKPKIILSSFSHHRDSTYHCIRHCMPKI